MEKDGRWRRRIGFGLGLCVATAAGTFVGLTWLNRQPDAPTTFQGPVTTTPPPSAPAANLPRRTLAWADAKPGTVYNTTTGLPEEVLDQGTKIELILIPPGTYTRGMMKPPYNNTQKDEVPPHQVIISKFFYLGKNEVTQGQWRKVMGENPSRFNKGDDFPVESIPATAVGEFLKRTSLRLPTEAEWEYACKAGGEEPLEGKTDLQGFLDGIAWHQQNSGGSTQPVGLKQENGFGLHDMLGNVAEWVGSWYDSAEYNRSVPSVTDPQGPQRGQELVYRGCSAFWIVQRCLCAARGHADPAQRFFDLGFRVAHNAD